MSSTRSSAGTIIQSTRPNSIRYSTARASLIVKRDAPRETKKASILPLRKKSNCAQPYITIRKANIPPQTSTLAICGTRGCRNKTITSIDWRIRSIRGSQAVSIFFFFIIAPLLDETHYEFLPRTCHWYARILWWFGGFRGPKAPGLRRDLRHFRLSKSRTHGESYGRSLAQ